MGGVFVTRKHSFQTEEGNRMNYYQIQTQLNINQEGEIVQPIILRTTSPSFPVPNNHFIKGFIMALSYSVRKQYNIKDKVIFRLEGTENVMEVEEDSTFEPVEKLQQFGINASDIQKLKDGGYYTIGMVLKTPQKVIVIVWINERN